MAGKWLLWVENDAGEVSVLKFAENPTDKQALAVATVADTKRLEAISIATDKVKIVANIDAKIAVLNHEKSVIQANPQNDGTPD